MVDRMVRRRQLVRLGGVAVAAGLAGCSSPTRISRPKLVAADGDSGDLFGHSVALSSDGATALVGAHADDDPNGEDAGSAYVLTPPDGREVRQTKLVASDGDAADLFGESVSLSGDGTTALVGAKFDYEPNGSHAGSAYVFSRAAGEWRQEAKLAAADGDDGDVFGKSVALSSDGTTALVGTDQGLNVGAAGAAYVFTRSERGWVQRAKLAPDDDSAVAFGWSVALSGDGATAVAGSGGDEVPGGAYVFSLAGGDWTRQARLSASDGDPGDRFGAVAVSNDGSTVLVGARHDEDPHGRRGGSAYVFERREGAWRQHPKLAAPDGDAEDRFGISVALSGDGTTALVGADGDEGQNGDRAGAAHAFSRAGDEWRHQTTLAAPDGDDADAFGWSVALSDDGTTALVGARSDENPNGDGAGSAYVFEVSGTGGTR